MMKMSMKFLKALTLLGLLVGALPATAFSQDLSQLRVITSVFPPYSFEQNNEVKGVAVNVIRKAFGKLGISPEIEIYPWARAIHTLRQTPNAVLFSVARSQEREAMFKWAGTVIDFDVHIYRKSERNDIDIKRLEDLKPHSFAGLNNDIKTQFLKRLGVDMYDVALEENAIKMLHADRVDLVASDKQAMEFRIEDLGLKQQDFVSAFRLSSLSKPLYLAANKNVDDELVEQLRQALVTGNL